MLTFPGSGKPICPKCKAAANATISATDPANPTPEQLQFFYRLHIDLCRTIGITDPGAIAAEWTKQTGIAAPVMNN